MSNVIATAAEYLVKLGVQLDTRNMAKFEGFLGASKLKAAALTGAIGALSTAIFKFVKDNTEYEQSLRQTARTQRRSINYLRAEQTALKSLGKTKQEIAKDPSLRKIYRELIDMGKAMSLPDMSGLLNQVQGLENAFAKLKMVASYACEWINYYLLVQLQQPIKNITDMMEKVVTWVQKNLTTFTRRIAVTAGDFLRGLQSIFTMLENIWKFVQALPDSVKSVGTQVLAIAALFKSGPLGWIITALTTIGDLMLDFENYKKKLAGEFTGRTALDGIWDIFLGTGNLSDKISQSLGLVSNALGNNGLIQQIQALLGGQEGLTTLGGDIWDKIVAGFGTATKTTGDLVALVGQYFGFTTSEDYENLTISGADNWLGGVGAALIASMFGVDLKGSIAIGLAGAMSGLTKDDLLSAENASASFQTAATAVLGAIFDGASKITTIAGDLTGTMATGLANALGLAVADTATWSAAFTGENSVWDSIVSGLFAGAVTGNTTAGIATSIVSLIANAFTETQIDEYGVPKRVMKSFGEGFETMWADFESIGSSIVSMIVSGMQFTTGFVGDIIDNLRKALDPDAADTQMSDENRAALSEIGTGLLGGLFTGSFAGGLMAWIGSVLSDAAKTDDKGKITGFDWGTVFTNYSTTASNFWGALTTTIQDFNTWWESEDGQKFQTTLNEAWDTATKALFGYTDDQGNYIAGLFTPVGEAIVGTIAGAFAGLWDMIEPYLQAIITNIEVAFMETDFGKALIDAGVIKPSSNAKYVSENEMGFDQVVNMYQHPQTYGNQDLLYGNTAVGYDPNTQSYIYTGDRFNIDGQTSAYGMAVDSVMSTINRLMSQGKVDQAKQISDVLASVNNSQQYGTQTQKADSATKKLNYELTLLANEATGTVQSYNLAGSAASAFADAVTKATVKINGSTGETEQNAWGGRYDSKTLTEVAEDGGREYIIPIDKPERAMTLISQMLTEMGGTAMQDLASRMGITGDTGTYGGNISGLGAGTTINNTITISAPISINVYGTGDPEDIGIAAYNASERYLMRTLRGVLA